MERINAMDTYEDLEMEVVEFETEDVITDSPIDGGIDDGDKD